MDFILNFDGSYRRHSIKYRTTKVIISFLILLLGGMIYVIYRDRSLLMFDWFNSIGIGNAVNWLRNLFQGEGIYDWIKYSLPDGLWVLSYMLIVDAIWDGHNNAISNTFLWGLPIVAVLSEFLQYFGILPGVFDWMDVASYMLAIISFMIIK